MHNNVIKISTISKSYVFTQKKERYTVRRQPSFVTFWWSVIPCHTLLVCEGRMGSKVLRRDRCREEVRGVHVSGDIQHCVILRGIPPGVVQCRRQFGFARRHYEHSNVTNLNSCTQNSNVQAQALFTAERTSNVSVPMHYTQHTCTCTAINMLHAFVPECN